MLPKGAAMTAAGVKEYMVAIRGRYVGADKMEKGRILDEAVRVTGYHRKAVVRLLGRREKTGGPYRRGRPRRYGLELARALKVLWEASGRVCSRRLHPFVPELIGVLRRHGEQQLTREAEVQLVEMSPSTIDRLLGPIRKRDGRRRFSTTKPGTLLRDSIPIRTFADWNNEGPGFLEIDLVAHCGESTEGLYLHTLSTVDIATGWVECQGVWGKGQNRVGSAIHHIAQRLPFQLLGLDSDNGSEFINHHLVAYCERQSHHLHSRPALQEERQRPRGAEELDGGASTGGIRPLQLPGGPRDPQPSLWPCALAHQLLPTGHETATQDSSWGQGAQDLRPRQDAISATAGLWRLGRATTAAPGHYLRPPQSYQAALSDRRYRLTTLDSF